jgi:hypothetical protein
MMNEPADHLEGVLNRPGRSVKRSGDAKKILNRGNEAKNLLNKKDLAFSGAQNELFIECKKPRSKRKNSACSAGPVPQRGIALLFLGRKLQSEILRPPIRMADSE